MQGSRSKYVRGKRLCPRCRKYKLADNKHFYHDARRWDGLSLYCQECELTKARKYYKKLSKAQLDQRLESKKAKVKELRLLILQHYGGRPPKCACCGEQRLEFLVIDHIEGGGHRHRETVKKTGVGFYWWIKRNGFPTGLRVLCHNCNMSRGCYGYCPHDKESGQQLVALNRSDMRFSRTKGTRYERRSNLDR